MLSFVFYKTLIYTFIPVFLQKKLVTVAVLGEGNWTFLYNFGGKWQINFKKILVRIVSASV